MAYPLALTKLMIRLGAARLMPTLRRRLDGGVSFLRYYSDRLLTAPVEMLEQITAAIEPADDDVIDLARGAPHFDALPSGTSKLPSDRRGWPPPDGLPELRSAVASHLLADGGPGVNPTGEVLITAGAIGAVHTAFDAFVNPGDRVVLSDPTSPLFALAANGRRARVSWLSTWVDDGRTRFRLAHLARALRGARLFVLCSPSNPTGGVVAPEDLEQIIYWANRYDVLLLADDSFARYSYDGASSRLAALPNADRRTLTIGGVSKSHALAAVRVGWLAGCRHLIRPCRIAAALRTPFVPTSSQQVALTALRADDNAFTGVRAGFVSRRRYAFERLRAAGLNPAWPNGAFFFWMPVWEQGFSGRQFADQLLRDKGVRVTPGDLFGPSGKGYIRLSYAADDGRLREGLNRIAEFLQKPEAKTIVAVKQAA